MDDRILTSFLEEQYREASKLAGKSDLVDVVPLGPEPHQLYAVRYSCKGLVRTAEGVGTCDAHEVVVRFPDDYLRRAHPAQVLTWWQPVNAWHPAIRYPYICPGHLPAGESFVELIYQCFDIITWRKVNMREDDCLNPEAAAWARAHQDRVPVDSQPLVRRRWNVQAQDSSEQKAKAAK